MCIHDIALLVAELSEDWTSIREPVIEGVPFYVRYLGSSIVQKASGEDATSDAIKTIISMAKNKKLCSVKLTISLQGIQMMDLSADEILLEISIYRISYCSADATYDRVFAFIATNKNETLECHAFLCPKRKMAQSATLTIAQAFNLAFELWQKSQDERNNHNNSQHHKNRSRCSRSGTRLPGSSFSSASSSPKNKYSSSGVIRECRYAQSRCSPCLALKCQASYRIPGCCSSSSQFSKSVIECSTCHHSIHLQQHIRHPNSYENSSNESFSGSNHLEESKDPSNSSSSSSASSTYSNDSSTHRPNKSSSKSRHEEIFETEETLLIDLSDIRPSFKESLISVNNQKRKDERNEEDPWTPALQSGPEVKSNNQPENAGRNGEEDDNRQLQDGDGTMHGKGNWVLFDIEENERMHNSFSELASRTTPHPLISTLPDNANQLGLSAFAIQPLVSSASPRTYLTQSQLNTPIGSPVKASHPIKLNPPSPGGSPWSSPRNRRRVQGSPSLNRRRTSPSAIPSRLTTEGESWNVWESNEASSPVPQQQILDLLA